VPIVDHEDNRLTRSKRKAYEGVTARRRRGHADATPAAASESQRLSPAKRRIAEALAAMLVAHYRREHAAPDPDRERRLR
jgi:hypothetical protein